MQQPPYQQQPMYQAPPPPPPLPPNYPGKQMITISIICGAVSLVFSLILSWMLSFIHPVVGAIFPVIGLVASIVGLIAAITGSKQARSVGIQSGAATAGLVLSIIGMVFCFIFAIACSCTACAYCQAEKALGDISDAFSGWDWNF